jgi:hypothetical protein
MTLHKLIEDAFQRDAMQRIARMIDGFSHVVAMLGDASALVKESHAARSDTSFPFRDCAGDFTLRKINRPKATHGNNSRGNYHSKNPDGQI